VSEKKNQEGPGPGNFNHFFFRSSVFFGFGRAALFLRGDDPSYIAARRVR
jgi:hypothetical protein